MGIMATMESVLYVIIQIQAVPNHWPLALQQQFKIISRLLLLNLINKLQLMQNLKILWKLT